MATPTSNTSTTPHAARRPQRVNTARVLLVVVGSAVLFSALVSPWWTRGVNLEDTPQFPASERPPGVEGIYANYSPFRTPGAIAGFTTDGSRAMAVAILGLGLVLCQAFAWTHLVIRRGMERGTLEENPDIPVRFAIAAFICGAFAVLWGALMLPLLGNNPGFLWGTEYGSTLVAETDGILSETRYANAGFYLGIVGAMAYPALLWAQAASARNAYWLRQAPPEPAEAAEAQRATGNAGTPSPVSPATPAHRDDPKAIRIPKGRATA